MGEQMIKVESLRRYYKTGHIVVKALNGVSFNVEKGEFVAIMGPSGSGKTTLLRILGLLDKQTSGSYTIEGLQVDSLPEGIQNHYRLTQLGYVFQDYALIDEMTASENIHVLSMMEGQPGMVSRLIAQQALDKVGLGDKVSRTPNQLSGGEKQRVAIARSIARNPKILFADEPCANLDTQTSRTVLEVFRDLNRRYKQTIIMVTHEPWHTRYVSRVINLRDGKIVSDKRLRHSRRTHR
jgi:putative ABC transport system ATP-binding protein